MKESCLCYMEPSSTDEACRMEDGVVMKLAEEIKKNFFLVKGSKKSPHRFGFALKSFRDFFARLSVHALTNPAENSDSFKQLSDLSRRLLSDELPVTSTFEFVQSESVEYLAVYLSNGACCNADLVAGQDVLEQLDEVQSWLQKFASLALTMSNGSSTNPLGNLVVKLLDTLHMCYNSFPVMLSDEQCTRESMMIPLRYPETQERTTLELKFGGQRGRRNCATTIMFSVSIFSRHLMPLNQFYFLRFVEEPIRNLQPRIQSESGEGSKWEQKIR